MATDALLAYLTNKKLLPYELMSTYFFDYLKAVAEAAVQAEIVEAKRKLKDEIAEQAAAMAEELIVKNLTPDDQVKITEQYLERVGTV